MIPNHLFSECVPPRSPSCIRQQILCQQCSISWAPARHEAFSDLLCYHSAIKVYSFASTLVEVSRTAHLRISNVFSTYHTAGPIARRTNEKSKKKKGKIPSELVQATRPRLNLSACSSAPALLSPLNFDNSSPIVLSQVLTCPSPASYTNRWPRMRQRLSHARPLSMENQLPSLHSPQGPHLKGFCCQGPRASSSSVIH